MHDHQADLILALVEGRLPAERAESARRFLSACAQCLAELEAQQAARQALRALPPPQLSDLERARIRRTVSAALQPSPVGRRAGTVPWGTVALAAAALIGVAVAAPLLASLGGAPQGEPETFDLRQADAPLEAAEAPAAGPEGDEFFLPELGDLGPTDPASLRAMLEAQEVPSLTRRDLPRVRAAIDERTVAPELPCYDEAGALSPTNLLLVRAGEGLFEGRPAVVFVFASASSPEPDASLDGTSLWVLAPDTCRILHSQLGSGS